MRFALSLRLPPGSRQTYAEEGRRRAKEEMNESSEIGHWSALLAVFLSLSLPPSLCLQHFLTLMATSSDILEFPVVVLLCSFRILLLILALLLMGYNCPQHWSRLYQICIRGVWMSNSYSQLIEKER